ncbi:MAG: polysaccharide biosynthesis/export family protein, partial [Pseudomonadota bacterium]
MVNRRRLRTLFAGIAGSLVVLLGANPSFAQTLPPQVLQELQRQQQEQGPRRDPSPVDQSRNRPTPEPIPQVPEQRTFQIPREMPEEEYVPSVIEKDVRDRLRNPELRQFGYQIFDAPPPNPQTLVGRASDQYVLGVGDEVVVIFQGNESGSYILPVDSEGRLILSEFKPVPAAGRTLADVRRDLENRTREAMLGTDVYVS